MLGRRRARGAAAADGAPRDDVTAVVVVTVDDDPRGGDRPCSDEAWSALRRIVAEAVILQDRAEELLVELRDERDLGRVAPPCGALIGRFAELCEALPSCGDPAMDQHAAVLRTILDHHVLMLDSSLALLASEWRSERLSAQLDRIDGLGAPARRLEAIRAEILSRGPQPPIRPR